MSDEIIVRIRSEGTQEFINNMKKAGGQVEKTGAKVEKTSDKMGKSFKKLGAVVGAAFATQQLIAFGKELARTAVEIDATGAKVSKVFGEAAKDVDRFARESATKLGLTSNEFKKAAAAAGDLLIPIGFQRKEAAKLSADLVKLSGALSAWSGGQLSAAEVSNILTKALLGEREQLKQLGIVIGDADVKAKLLEKGQAKLTGTLLAQAKATATLELIYAKSTDAQDAFNDGTKTLAEQQLELTANLRELKDQLAEALLPALKDLLPVISENTIAFGEWIKVQSDAETRSKSLQAVIDLFSNGFELLKERLRFIGEGFTAIANLIGSVARLFGLAGEDASTFGGTLEIVGKVAEKFEKGVGFIVGTMTNVVEGITKAVDKVNEWGRAVKNFLGIGKKKNKLIGDETEELQKQLIAQQILDDARKKANQTTKTTIKNIDKETEATEEQKKAIDALTKSIRLLTEERVKSAIQLGLSALRNQTIELEKQGGVLLDIKKTESELITSGKIKNKISTKGLDSIKEKQEQANIEAEKQQENRLTGAQDITNALFDLEDSITANRLQNLEKQRDQGLITEKEFQEQAAEIKRKAAIADKAQALFGIAINTARGITAALALLPPNPVLAGIIGATGAIQAAAVAAQPIPQFAKGTKGKRKAPEGFAWVGEEGPELVQMKGGENVLTAQDSEELMRLLAGYSIPVQFAKTEDKLQMPLRSLKSLSSNPALDKIDWNPLLNASDFQRRSLGKKLDMVNMNLVKMNNGLTRRMTKN